MLAVNKIKVCKQNDTHRKKTAWQTLAFKMHDFGAKHVCYFVLFVDNEWCSGKFVCCWWCSLLFLFCPICLNILNHCMCCCRIVCWRYQWHLFIARHTTRKASHTNIYINLFNRNTVFYSCIFVWLKMICHFVFLFVRKFYIKHLDGAGKRKCYFE